MSRLIARQGWLGVTADPAYGGMGLGHLAKTIIIEELSRVSGAMGAMVQASQLGVAKIVHFGDEEQKRHLPPRVSDGRCLPTIAVTEPDAGGHLLGMASTAERVGDEYVLNGRKVFVGNSTSATCTAWWSAPDRGRAACRRSWSRRPRRASP
ncbi:acyl-CoA dehydrogenase family protein [Saccharothrix sp. S26]|uniref:acyl-CoA dehydrogenase family protein n=1 Tax=Saccharothrix sp. S26 TaxID=2907215 RepID=UPI001F341F1C|nr:acyl-CoA dehydrogenase family protein [Saccharothrix sp. S26]MCE6996540.1 acyl-CoA dehydrogenase family protein [Saccharothrix sp. S26]